MQAIGLRAPAPTASRQGGRFRTQVSALAGLPRLLLVGGLLVHLLLFLRVAVVFAPDLYLGPSGADRVFYFAYVRSLVFDGDLDFTNEMALWPPSSGLQFQNGQPINKYPVGAPLVALPAYFVTHRVLRAVTPQQTALTGYERPYVYAYALSHFVVGMLGLYLLFLALLRYVSPLTSAIAVVGASLGTGLLRYTTTDLIMSHAAASFAASWCLFEAIRIREDPVPLTRWLMLGAASALVPMVRLQNGIFLLVPAVAALEALGAMWHEYVRTRVVYLVAALGTALLAFMPQLLAWRVMFGAWLANGYSNEMSFTWLAPRVRDVVLLLAQWVPLLAIGYAGTVWLAFRRRDLLLAAAAVCGLGTIYVTASWFAVDIVTRTAFDSLAPIAVGLAVVAGVLRRVYPGAEWAALVLPALWNVPFLMFHDSSVGFAGLVPEWQRGMALLFGVDR